jgi:hypothetical protein
MATAAVERLKRKLPERLRYESGTTPHTDFLITLALKESISIDWLLLGKGKMKRSR